MVAGLVSSDAPDSCQLHKGLRTVGECDNTNTLIANNGHVHVFYTIACQATITASFNGVGSKSRWTNGMHLRRVTFYSTFAHSKTVVHALSAIWHSQHCSNQGVYLCGIAKNYHQQICSDYSVHSDSLSDYRLHHYRHGSTHLMPADIRNVGPKNRKVCESIGRHECFILHFSCVYLDRSDLCHSACIHTYVHVLPLFLDFGIWASIWSTTVWDVKLPLKLKVSIIIILGFSFIYVYSLLLQPIRPVN